MRTELPLDCAGPGAARFLPGVDADGDGDVDLFSYPMRRWEIEPATGLPVSVDSRTFGVYRSLDSVVQLSGPVLGDVDGDGGLEHLVASDERIVVVRDAATLDVETIWDPSPGCLRWTVADVSPEPGDEFACWGGGALSVWTVGASTPIWTTPADAPSDRAIAVLQADADPQLEIALTGITFTRIYDCSTRSVQLEVPFDLLNRGLGDLDGDGRDEALNGPVPRPLTAHDLDDEAVEKWTIEETTHATFIGDLDHDGRPELLLETGLGSTLVLDGTTGEQVDVLPEGSDDASDFQLIDLDRDCADDLLFYHRGFPGSVVVFDPATLELIAEREGDCVMGVRDIGDLDADGRTEVVRVHYLEGTLQLQSTDRNHHVSESSRRALTPVPGGPLYVRLVQCDADPQLEAVVFLQGGLVSAYDGISGELQWSSSVFNWWECPPLVADSNGDGWDEIYWVTAEEDMSGFEVRRVKRIDSRTGNLSGTFEAMESQQWPQALGLAQADGDAQLELITVSRGLPWATLRTHDLATVRQEWSKDLYFEPRSVTLVDVDQDGDRDVVIAETNRLVHAYDLATRSRLWFDSFGFDETGIVGEGDVDGDGTPELLMLQGGSRRAYLVIRSVPDLAAVWQSEMLAQDVSGTSRIQVLDIDDDGKREIVLPTAIFEYADGPVDADGPGFEPPIAFEAVVATPTARVAAVDLSWSRARDAASPPVTYEVHRAGAAGVPTDASTLITRTPVRFHRDALAPPGATAHYQVVAVDSEGNRTVLPLERSAEVPLNPGPPPPTDVRLDSSPCPEQGVLLSFQHAGWSETLTFELWRDAVPFLRGVTSGWRFDPGDSLSHAYVVVARERGACARAAESSPVTHANDPAPASAPTGVSLLDDDPCSIGQLELTFSHPGFPQAGHHELIRDGRVFLPDVRPGTVFRTGDAVTHEYVVRAVYEDCTARDSEPLEHADGVGCDQVGEVRLFLRRGAPDTLRIDWTAAVNATSYDALIGTLGALDLAVYDHAVDDGTASFPDSLTPTDGCDVASGAATSARVVDLAGDGRYVLVLARQPGSSGPLGRRSDGLDRSEPLADPRPTEPCP